MNIIHVVESLAGAGGGLPAAVKSLAGLQDSFGYRVGFAETAASSGDASLKSTGALRLKGRSVLSSFSKLHSFCKSIVGGRYDFVHIHGIWNPSFILICIACKLGGTRYVVTTHGQLLSTILNADSRTKRLKKKIYHALFGRAILTGAYKVHVSSENERLEFMPDAVLSRKVVLIPHIIDPVFFGTADARNGIRDQDAKFKDVLFVGRLDPRKGVMDLIDGFARASLGPEWRLKLVGPSSDPHFMDLILGKIAETKLEHRVIVESPVYGDARADLYASCHVFCLPSYSEAPGLVNIEAALLARPVITTRFTGLFDIDSCGGVLCDTGSEAISTALREVASWSSSEYALRSVQIRKWAESAHSLDVLIPRWKAFYSTSL